MASRSRLGDLLAYAGFRIVLAVLRSFGPAGARRLAAGAADLVLCVESKYGARARRHLEGCLPDLPEARREEIVRSAFRSFALTIGEAILMDRILHPGSVDRLLDVHIAPEAQAAVDEGRGAIFVTAHLGNWELTGAGVALLGIRLASVARPFGNDRIDRYVAGVRERLGQRIILKKGAVREMARVLREGGYLGVLVDQNAGRRGVFVPFFGRLASTTAAPATLALRFRVPLIPAWQRRLPGGKSRIEVEPPLPLPDTGDRAEDVRRLTAAMTARVEAWVRAEPGQWLWAHRRFRSRQADEVAAAAGELR